MNDVEKEKDEIDDINRINEKNGSGSAGINLLTLMDSFIEQVLQMRRTLLGVSISALILAPIAIGLSIFLIRHPSIFEVLKIKNEFGIVLIALLGAVIIISSIWLITGTRQYMKIGSWDKRYYKYTAKKELIDQELTSKYGL